MDLDDRIAQAKLELLKREVKAQPKLVPCGKLCRKCTELTSSSWVKKNDDLGINKFVPVTGSGRESGPECLLVYSIADLEGEAERGCHLCFMFLEARCITERDGSEVPWIEVFVDPAKLHITTVSLFLGWTALDCSRLHVEVPIAHVDLAASLRRESIKAVKRLATQCDEEHGACCIGSSDTHPPRSSFQGPRRLLQISGNNQGLELRLVEAEKWPANLRYITLSHCWGPDGCPLQLTESNRTDFLQSIDMSSLPRTFFESIVFTWALGISSIWIDALCIVQDNKEDWSSEGLQMSSVYSGSFLNLVATAASNSNDGLFCQTESRLASPLCIKSSWSGSELDTALWLVEGHARLREYTVNQSSLAKRAWVYQERFLAPRSVLFAADTIRFECQQCMIPEALLNSMEPFAEGRLALPNLSLPDRTAWAQVVQSYSGLDLTYCRDKLVALAGVAKTFARANHYEDTDYLAGHWKKDLVESLSWSRLVAYSPLQEYRAPSGSWAAGEGHAYYDTRSSEQFLPVNVIEASVVANGYFGEVESGHLILAAHVYSLQLHHETSTSHAIREGDVGISAIVSSSHYSGDFYGGGPLSDFYPDDNEVCGKLETAQIYLPLVFLLRPDWSLVRGLVLALIDHEHGVYKRVGLVQLHSGNRELPGAGERFVHEDIPWFHQPQTLPQQFYQSKDQDGRYRIKII